ncbi:MAG: hypothetical protein E6235_01800 [Anaerococcus vaginalis]|uniref:hypothetical protein n=1 Tax=Anaerococcus vaginalis TaxID=33037 RepID=UPI00291110FF|nr:hypothetical protein [Anaerococcus vaginalis]MDU5085764.1 hypothetical protein [Anaerococcus vaginalis]
MLIFLGQILVFIILLSFYFLIRKNTKKYEDKTKKEIENEKNIEKLKKLRNEKISYKSKANITKRIIDISYTKEECENLKKYTSTYDDMIFYYSALIKNERDDRKKYKQKRDEFIKRYKNRHFIFPDYKENLKTSIKWIGVFLIFSLISYLNPFKFIKNQEIYGIVVLLNFTFNLALVVNTIIWILRSLKSYWAKNLL